MTFYGLQGTEHDLALLALKKNEALNLAMYIGVPQAAETCCQYHQPAVQLNQSQSSNRKKKIQY